MGSNLSSVVVGHVVQKPTTLKVGLELERNPLSWRLISHGGSTERERESEREILIITYVGLKHFTCFVKGLINRVLETRFPDGCHVEETPNQT